MTWPRGWALAEVLWSGPAKTDWDEFWPRVEKHFERADVAGINYARSMYNAIITPYKENNECLIKLDCELKDSDIYYTFDNTDRTHFLRNTSNHFVFRRMQRGCELSHTETGNLQEKSSPCVLMNY